MRSKVFIFSGPFGGGKTETAVSYLAPGKKEQTVRLVVDPELRADTYQSADGVDHPEKHLFAFTFLNENGLKAEDFFGLMKMVHEEKWIDFFNQAESTAPVAGKLFAKPDVVILDNVAMIQDLMFEFWKTKKNIFATASLYGKEKDRLLTKETIKVDPGFINLCKTMFKYFLLDLKNQGISVVITSPPHNVWKGYNKTGYDANGDPLMKILGQTANVMDAWVQLTDVIWNMTRQEKKGDTTTMLKVPHVSMDMFNPKAALPGVPEQFEWPGWAKIWDWYNTRAFEADVTKLAGQNASWSAEQEEEATKLWKLKFIKELKGILSVDQIVAIFKDPETPAYTRDNHAELLEFFKEIAPVRYPGGPTQVVVQPAPAAPAAEPAPVEQVPAQTEPAPAPAEQAPAPAEAPAATDPAPVATRTVDMLITEASQYGLKNQLEVFGFLKKKGFSQFDPAFYDQYVTAFQSIPTAA